MAERRKNLAKSDARFYQEQFEELRKEYTRLEARENELRTELGYGPAGPEQYGRVPKELIAFRTALEQMPAIPVNTNTADAWETYAERWEQLIIFATEHIKQLKRNIIGFEQEADHTAVRNQAASNTTARREAMEVASRRRLDTEQAARNVTVSAIRARAPAPVPAFNREQYKAEIERAAEKGLARNNLEEEYTKINLLISQYTRLEQTEQELLRELGRPPNPQNTDLMRDIKNITDRLEQKEKELRRKGNAQTTAENFRQMYELTTQQWFPLARQRMNAAEVRLAALQPDIERHRLKQSIISSVPELQASRGYRLNNKLPFFTNLLDILLETPIITERLREHIQKEKLRYGITNYEPIRRIAQECENKGIPGALAAVNEILEPIEAAEAEAERQRREAEAAARAEAERRRAAEAAAERQRREAEAAEAEAERQRREAEAAARAEAERRRAAKAAAAVGAERLAEKAASAQEMEERMARWRMARNMLRNNPNMLQYRNASNEEASNENTNEEYNYLPKGWDGSNQDAAAEEAAQRQRQEEEENREPPTLGNRIFGFFGAPRAQRRLKAEEERIQADAERKMRDMDNEYRRLYSEATSILRQPSDTLLQTFRDFPTDTLDNQMNYLFNSIGSIISQLTLDLENAWRRLERAYVLNSRYDIMVLGKDNFPQNAKLLEKITKIHNLRNSYGNYGDISGSYKDIQKVTYINSYINMLQNDLLVLLEKPFANYLHRDPEIRTKPVRASIFLMNIYKKRLEDLLEFQRKRYPAQFPEPKEKTIGVVNWLLQLGGKTRKARKARKSNRYSRRR